MPAPNPNRNHILKYLRYEFPHSKPLSDPGSGKIFTVQEVKAALLSLAKSDPGYHRILYLWYNGRSSRLQIAAAAGMDSSTVKRRMDASVDIILMYLLHPDLTPEDPVKFFGWDDD